MSPLSEDFLLLSLSFEEVWFWILKKRSWMLVGQLFVLKGWRSNFKPSKDMIQKVFTLDVWDNDMILKIASRAEKSKFLDPWTINFFHLGFVRVYM